jgi:Ala-tRNA(Pro) deacylase
MATPMWIRRMLRLRGIPFEERRHPEAFTAQEVARYEHFSGSRVAKVVVALVAGRPVELVLPADRHVRLDLVKRALGAADVRLATEEEMAAFFDDSAVGAVPPLRHWTGVDVVLDRSLQVQGDILFQAGTHEDAIRVSFRDWYEMVRPRTATFSEPAEAAHV